MGVAEVTSHCSRGYSRWKSGQTRLLPIGHWGSFQGSFARGSRESPLGVAEEAIPRFEKQGYPVEKEKLESKHSLPSST